jgi:predicted flavoprotein YhiN
VSSTPQVPFQIFDAIIIGAGAAGLFCAAQAGQQGLKCC